MTSARLPRLILRALLYLAIALTALCFIVFLVVAVLYLTADDARPTDYTPRTHAAVWTDSTGTRHFDDATLSRDAFGHWLLRISGDAYTRGEAVGSLTDSLLRHQEDVFVAQLDTLIPSHAYRAFLRYLVVAFNRRLGSFIPEEYRREIYAISHHCTHDYDWAGTPYFRQLNYHAAHDIGHAMQSYRLVGCSAFAVADSSRLLLARNFDFYVGDAFAENKLLTFCRPDSGYAYVSVGWPGLVGVVSAMNAEGLCLTLNASAGPMPFGSGTPVSLIARHIIQYAATLDEAVAIARASHSFVSENFVLLSARDRRAVVIEKSPDTLAVYAPDAAVLTCTNHFRSPLFADEPHNRRAADSSDSSYRLRRLEQLTAPFNASEKPATPATPTTPATAVSVLRDRRGVDDAPLGWANPWSLNQSIAHHSVIFSPDSLLLWVSTDPYQDGAFACYDLRSIWASAAPPMPDTTRTIAPNPEVTPLDFTRLAAWRSLSHRIVSATAPLPPDTLDRFIALNPDNYLTYEVLRAYAARFSPVDTSRFRAAARHPR